MYSWHSLCLQCLGLLIMSQIGTFCGGDALVSSRAFWVVAHSPLFLRTLAAMAPETRSFSPSGAVRMQAVISGKEKKCNLKK